MKLSLFIISLLIPLTLHNKALAESTEPSVASDSVEDLSVQKESDQLDVFDQKAIEAESKKETAALIIESKHLERDIERLHDQSKDLSQRIGKESGSYAQASQNYRKIESEMKKNQSARNHLKSEVDSLNAKVSKLKEKISKARSENARLVQDVRQHQRAKARLEAKKRQADAELKRQNDANSKLRSKG